MTNYIPADKEDKLQLEESNLLYKEIFDRRASGRCDECDDIGHENLCSRCAHNSDSDIKTLNMSEISIKKIRKAKKFSERPKILKKIFGDGRCPCCDPNKGWTKSLIVFFSNLDAEIKLGNCIANYCPICGRNLEN